MISVSIVTYNNTADDLRAVIDCIHRSPAAVLYIIDNSPSDALQKFAANCSPKVSYIYPHRNIGYGAAHNIAIRRAGERAAKYHLVLNADVHFDPRVIDELLAFMERHPDVGLVMPKILYPSGETQHLCKLLPTPADLIFRRFFPFIPGAEKKRQRYELRTMDNTQPHFDIPSLSGCFMLMRTAVLEEIAGFDERFFLYMEDVDLCRRLHRISRTAFYPDVSIVHHYAKGSYKNTRLMRYHIYAAIKYFNKWGWFFDKERRIINKRALKELLIKIPKHGN
ncbi:MAG: glycosyltransferase family 2 protein [Prevotellaceae bacterium]|jgi:GT2 family glycosyltransferase|nr:glycosyltransferase family 2 protein [Prevotellaceae bacterium]